ncbi:MAG: AAA family ATPase, partial [Nocardioides sp.]
TQSLAAERIRNASGSAVVETASGRDPDQLEAEADRVAEQERLIGVEVDTSRAALDAAVTARKTAEDAAAEEERRISGLQRAAADRREGLARLHGQVNALKSRAAGADEEVARLRHAREEALTRAERAQMAFTALETKVAGLDAGEEGLDAEHEEAAALLDDVEERLAVVRDQAQQADRDRHTLSARKDALELGLARKDGAGALLAAGDELPGVLGSIAALLSVQHGHEAAVAAALGSGADAVAVRDPEAALAALGHLKGNDLGRAALLLAAGPDLPDAGDWPALPAGAQWAVDVVECSAELQPAVSALLDRVAVVEDLTAARALVAAEPSVTAVTAEGDLLGARFVSGGSSDQPSLLEIQAAVEEAEAALAEAVAAGERAAFETSRLEAERHEATKRVDVALARLHESDATLAAVAEELGQHGSQARAARGEAERLEQAIARAEEAREQPVAGPAEHEERLAAAEQTPEEEPDTGVREELAEAARAARQAEMDARLALRTSEERARALHGRADGLRRSAAKERDARAQAAARRAQVIREGRAAEAAAAATTYVLHRLEVSVQAAADARAAVEEARRGREEELRAVRARLRELAKEHEELVSSVHRDEVARTQQRMRIEQLENRTLEELGLEPDALVADYGPDQLVPLLDAAGAEPGAAGEDGEDGDAAPRTVPFVREEQVKRLKAAERALSMLGKVNPLALEEFSALEERHQFLSEQLEDLRRTRKDLLDIVKDVDDRVEQVFREAYADVEKAFDATFARLFPGGEGRLVLTDPDNMLSTGVEVEARPPGKKVKRLSLLSGGERSLVAVAFLVALFKARPSPFYILDEVEAALDDTNLGRLLQIYEELRENSQLLVITHQKRTMEVGDALYGVTMRGDGVSAVISQRLREQEPA